MYRPPIGTKFKECGIIHEVVSHTERGVKYAGEQRPFISREGSYFTGEGEMFLDIIGWQYYIDNNLIQIF